MGDEFAGGFEVVFGGGKVEGCLAAEVWVGRLIPSISLYRSSGAQAGKGET